jgi:hypothetical protein
MQRKKANQDLKVHSLCAAVLLCSVSGGCFKTINGANLSQPSIGQNTNPIRATAKVLQIKASKLFKARKSEVYLFEMLPIAPAGFFKKTLENLEDFLNGKTHVGLVLTIPGCLAATKSRLLKPELFHSETRQETFKSERTPDRVPYSAQEILQRLFDTDSPDQSLKSYGEEVAETLMTENEVPCSEEQKRIDPGFSYSDEWQKDLEISLQVLESAMSKRSSLLKVRTDNLNALPDATIIHRREIFDPIMQLFIENRILSAQIANLSSNDQSARFNVIEKKITLSKTVGTLNQSVALALIKCFYEQACRESEFGTALKKSLTSRDTAAFHLVQKHLFKEILEPLAETAIIGTVSDYVSGNFDTITSFDPKELKYTGIAWPAGPEVLPFLVKTAKTKTNQLNVTISDKSFLYARCPELEDANRWSFLSALTLRQASRCNYARQYK